MVKNNSNIVSSTNNAICFIEVPTGVAFNKNNMFNFDDTFFVEFKKEVINIASSYISIFLKTEDALTYKASENLIKSELQKILEDEFKGKLI